MSMMELVKLEFSEMGFKYKIQKKKIQHKNCFLHSQIIKNKCKKSNHRYLFSRDMKMLKQNINDFVGILYT